MWGARSGCCARAAARRRHGGGGGSEEASKGLVQRIVHDMTTRKNHAAGEWGASVVTLATLTRVRRFGQSKCPMMGTHLSRHAP